MPILLPTNQRPKPILKWVGGKTALVSRLGDLFPETCRRYIEPFLGGGAVLLALDSSIEAIASDFNEEIINLYKVVRDAPNALMEKLDQMREMHSEEFYYALRKAERTNDLDRAVRTLFLNKTGFNGLYRQNKKGEFNVPWGHKAKCPALYDRENLLNVSQRLQNVSLTACDFEQTIALAGDGDVVYCDPPYEPISKTSSFTGYVSGGFFMEHQKRLHDAVVSASGRGAHVFVSNSYCKNILDLYEAHEIATVDMKRSINSKGDARGKVKEVIVCMRR